MVTELIYLGSATLVCLGMVWGVPFMMRTGWKGQEPPPRRDYDNWGDGL